MPDKNEALEESTEEIQEIVDFDSPDSRMAFLKGQLNDLLDGINNAYGQDLMEELLKRLEKTIENYNTEVSGLMGKLKSGKIFDADEPGADIPSPPVEDDPGLGLELAEEKSADEQDAEDSDIIARMRARISHD
ncbi:MAG: hypothetical protein HQ508_09040 [Candidatus Marinimicrobia bacterium]|nr:hypothetical protein [Candidatus Neomarinimicrobiota bacterium]